ncbi:glycosyltransferase [Kineosporia sp. J2-2]|uniref:Glycosyltransferase n=1 Tax=Kineosporia corallincola TaxID=2835133 RepID=A0ABS5TEK4_9ACTN|nr:glycosyltransferase [Kineosporia corallincola]MBT0769476.1 glycosyltransferase [Kineosporia corallincola]
MKIAVITSLAGPGSVAGGVWEVVVNQVTALRETGHEVTVVAGWLGEAPPSHLRGFPVTLVPVRPVVKPMGLRLLVGRGWKQAVLGSLVDADLAHVHVCRDFLSLNAVQTASHSRVPVVAQPHGMLQEPRNFIFKAFDRCFTRPTLRRVSRFLTITDAEVPQLSSFGIATVGHTTIHNSAAAPSRAWGPPPGRPRLLFASRLHPRKQVMVFAQAVMRLRALGHDVQGVVAGSDEGDLSALRKFCAESPDQQGIQYVGELSREELDEQLSQATAFVFPSRHEPFGLILVEALAIGTPVVSTTETPLRHIISQADAARFAEPTVEAITESLSGLLGDPARQTALSENGRRLYHKRWTKDVMVQNLTGLYVDVIQRNLAEETEFRGQSAPRRASPSALRPRRSRPSMDEFQA